MFGGRSSLGIQTTSLCILEKKKGVYAMKQKWSLFFCLLFLSSCSSVNKETSEASLLQELRRREKETERILKEQNLSLEEAIQIAKERNLELKTKQLEKEIAKIDSKIAFGNFLPQISAFYTRSFWEEALSGGLDLPTSFSQFPLIGPMLPKEIQGRLLDKSYSVYGLQASMPIFAPATWFLYSARRRGEEIHSLVLKLTEKMISIQIIQQYYWILALEAEEIQLKASLESSEQLLHNMKIALDTQSILEWQYQKIQAYYKQKKLALEQNRRDLKLAKMNLLSSLNLSPLSQIRLQKKRHTTIKKLDSYEEVVYQALLHNDALEIQEKVLSLEKEKIKISLSRFLPIIGLQGFYGEHSLSLLASSHYLLGILGGVFSIFNGFQDISSYQKAKIEQQKAILKKENLILQSIMETTNVYQRLESSIEEEEIAEMNEKAEMGKFHQKTVEKKVGMIDELSYLQAVQSYEEAKSLSLKAKYQSAILQEMLNMLLEQGRFMEEGENND